MKCGLVLEGPSERLGSGEERQWGRSGTLRDAPGRNDEGKGRSAVLVEAGTRIEGRFWGKQV